MNLSRLQFEQIQRIASEQQATIVEYSLIGIRHKNSITRKHPGGELFIWVVHPDGHLDFRRVDIQPLIAASQAQISQIEPVYSVYKIHEALGLSGRTGQSARRNVQFLRRELRYFHRLLIAPIASLLPTDPNAHVIFIPQHALFLLPFCALQDNDGYYLIEKHTPIIAPSIQILERTHRQGQRSQDMNDKLLIVGNPLMPEIRTAVDQLPEKLSQLPNAQKEAEDIADLFHTEALTGAAATKPVVLERMLEARIIHLATHGLLDEILGMGLPGAIALAPTDDNPETMTDNMSLLTSEEILRLKLKALLVVLSACNTGKGRVTGDSIIGLSRSFIAAGVPSLIVSLWSVPDAPTAFLMTEFYQALQQKQDVAQALRSAMLITKKQHGNLAAWGAFTLIGESQTKVF